MAVKVIGKDDSLKKKKTCKHCSAELEYLPVDVKKEPDEFQEKGYNYIECAVCGHRVVVP